MKCKCFHGIENAHYDNDMYGRTFAGLLWGLCLCFTLLAETSQAASTGGCGQDIRTRDVMVLDLEPFGNDLETTRKYLFEYAGEYRLLDMKPEEIILRSRPGKDPHAMFRRAQKLGEKKGCDLVLILKTGPYFGKQRGWRMKRIRDGGYAFVVVGQRLTYE